MRILTLTIVILVLLATPVLAEEAELESGRWFTLYSDENAVLLRTGIHIQVGDRFLDSANRLYQVYKVDEGRLQAWAKEVTAEETEAAVESEGLPGANNRRIAVYHTHSGESYQPTEGVDSTDRVPGGVYGVGAQLTKRFEKDGDVEAVHCQDTYFPYEGAYRRSRAGAIDLVEGGDLDAIFDLHRDAAPQAEYYQEIDDMRLTQVMIVVGKQNPVHQTNEEFAWQLKQVADSMYPQLVKGIFYARGGYNQDLHPRALLLEIGAHTNSRLEAEVGGRAFADVIYVTLYGPLPRESQAEKDIKRERQLQPTADPGPGRKGGIWKGLFTLAGFLGVGGFFYLFLSTGSWQGVKETLDRFFRVEFMDLFQKIPWKKFNPSYLLQQLRQIKIGAGAPPKLRLIQERWQKLFRPKNRI